jgi:hypothetical protein
MKLKKQYMLFLLFLATYSAFGMQVNDQNSPSLIDQDLVNAIRGQNIKVVKDLIAAGSQFNREHDGANAFLAEAIDAIELDNLEEGLIFLDELIDLGAIVARTHAANSKLSCAINEKDLILHSVFYDLSNITIACCLLGGDMNKQTLVKKITPLHLAVVMGRIKVIDTLVLLGADKNRKNVYGRTPYHYALGGQGVLRDFRRN